MHGFFTGWASGMLRSGLLLAATVLTGCATSTAPGVIGVERSQLLIVSSATVNAQASAMYSQNSTKAATEGRLNTDPAMTQRVRSIGSRLIKEVSVFRPDATHWAWEINVIESQELNAFCLPGGKIAFYSGIITRLDLSDHEIAAIMGHEIAHALREHGREKVSQSTLSNAIVRGIASSGSRNAGSTAALAGLSAKLFISLPFSREMESEADLMGIELMARAGYDPSKASNVWRKMMAQSGGNGVEFFSTHPNSERRIVTIDEAVPRVQALYDARLLNGTAIASGQLAGALASTATPRLTTIAEKKEGEATSSLLVTSAAPKAATKTKILDRTGQWSYQVRSLVHNTGCAKDPIAYLEGKGPGFENYKVECESGDPLRFRCEFGNCRLN